MYPKKEYGCQDCGTDNPNDFYGRRKTRCTKCQNKITVDRIKAKRLRILELLGNKCSICGFTDERALQIDHVNGGGTAKRKNWNYGKYYKLVLEEINNGSKEYRCLCANCNVIEYRGVANR